MSDSEAFEVWWKNESRWTAERDQQYKAFKRHYESLSAGEKQELRSALLTLQEMKQTVFDLPLFLTVQYLIADNEGGYDEIKFTPAPLIEAMDAWDKGDCFAPDGGFLSDY